MEAIIFTSSSYGASTAACFDPHFALVYYKKRKIVGPIDFCLDCNYLSSSKLIKETSYHDTKEEDLIYRKNGFSIQTRKKIHEFCKELGFTKHLKPLTSVHDGVYE